MDDMEANPEKYKGKKLSELTDDEDFDDENSVEYTKVHYKKALLPKIILVSTFLLSIIRKHFLWVYVMLLFVLAENEC